MAEKAELELDFDTASKDELAEYASVFHQVKLDLRKDIAVLVDECKALAGKSSKGATAKAAKPAAVKVPQYVLNPANGRVLPATPQLLKRGDLIPCNKQGKPHAAD